MSSRPKAGGIVKMRDSSKDSEKKFKAKQAAADKANKLEERKQERIKQEEEGQMVDVKFDAVQREREVLEVLEKAKEEVILAQLASQRGEGPLDESGDKKGKVNEAADALGDKKEKADEVADSPGDKKEKADEVADSPGDKKEKADEAADSPGDKKEKANEAPDDKKDGGGGKSRKGNRSTRRVGFIDDEASDYSSNGEEGGGGKDEEEEEEEDEDTDTYDDESGVDENGEDREDKWSPHISRQAAGLGKYDQRIVGGVKRWATEMLVTSDGPKNSARYRLRKRKDVPGAALMDITDLISERFGDLKGPDRKFIYGKEHFATLQGVAWVSSPDILKDFSTHFPNSWDLVKPKSDGYPTIKGKEMALVDCLVKVKWIIGGSARKAWETRATVRRCLGKTAADKAIHECAEYQEMLYEAWSTGSRVGKSQSPTPAPASARWRRGTSEPPGQKQEKPAEAQELKKPAEEQKKASQAEEDEAVFEEIMDRWLKSYKRMFYNGKTDFSDEEQMKIMDAWTASKEYARVTAH